MAERDEWGRIPAVLVEQDQEFCALRWGEFPCGAGPQDNYQIFSRDLGNYDFWRNEGTVSNSPFENPVGNGEPIKMVTLADGEDLEIIFNQSVIAQLPVFTEQNRLYCRISYNSINTMDFLAINIVGFRPEAGSTSIPLSVDLAAETISGSSLLENKAINDDPGALGWKVITFDVDSDNFLAPGTTGAYAVTLFASPTGSGDIDVAQPQISLSSGNDFYPTDESPKIANEVPCFNTVSSCQALETYSVDGRADALALIIVA